MVQVIQSHRQKQPSFLQSIAGGLVEGVSPALEKYQSMQKEAKQKQAAANLYGEDVSNLSPEMQKIYANESLKGENQRKKSFQDQIADKESYDIIKDRFGQETADLWQASPVGGRTKLLQNRLENEQRSQGLKEQFGQSDEINLNQKKEVKPSFKVVDYDKGLTPKERVARQNSRYEKALPLIQASQTKTHAYDTIGEELQTLKELSPQISGWERLNIDPRNGDLIIPALASPEAQQFVKTINDFTIQAKDSYGSRVTNFDLNQFMRRLPTLANSQEGRERILGQMETINDLNKMYEKSLQDMLEEHGGVRNIDYDRATDLALKEFQKNSGPLKTQLKELSSADKRDFKHIVEEKKRKAPKGQVLMMTANGEFGYVPESEVNSALKDGLTVQ